MLACSSAGRSTHRGTLRGPQLPRRSSSGSGSIGVYLQGHGSLWFDITRLTTQSEPT